VGPLLRLAVLRRLERWLISSPVAWLAMNLTFLGWHVPAAYDFALTHKHWHDFEHLLDRSFDGVLTFLSLH